MTTQKQKHETLFDDDLNINREEFPPLDDFWKKHTDRGEAYLKDVSEVYKKICSFLEKHHLFDSEIGKRVVGYFKNAFDEVDKSKPKEDPVGDLRQLGQSILGIGKGLLKEAKRFILPEKSDAAFLLTRYYEYHKELLSYVTLEDPLDKTGNEQDPVIGRAVLIYEDPSKPGSPFSVRISGNSLFVGNLELNTEVDLSDKKSFQTLIKYLNKGRKGVLERTNVFFVKAPSYAGLDPEVVLNRAAYLYLNKR